MTAYFDKPSDYTTDNVGWKSVVTKASSNETMWLTLTKLADSTKLWTADRTPCLIVLPLFCVSIATVNSLLWEQRLPSRYLATDISIVFFWLCTSSFQVSCHIVPSLRLFIPNSLVVYRRSFFFFKVSACGIFLWLGLSAVTILQPLPPLPP
jgi:hypothetical protein